MPNLPDKDRRDAMISIRLAAGADAALRTSAAASGESVSSYVRRVLLDAVDRRTVTINNVATVVTSTTTVGAEMGYIEGGVLYCRPRPMRGTAAIALNNLAATYVVTSASNRTSK